MHHVLSKRRLTVTDWNILVTPGTVILCCVVFFYFPKSFKYFIIE